MKFNIPDMSTAFDLVKDTKSFVVRKEAVDGEEFAIFTYRFVDYNEFLENVCRLEFRGIAYHLRTGKYFLSIHKFFNYREVPETDVAFDKKKEYVAFEKIDGSLIIPVLLKDRILVKSRSSFFSDHAKTAYKLIKENKNYEEFIRYCYKKGLQPMFELVSPFYRVVIEYSRTELILIQVREMETGHYADLSQFKQVCKSFGIRTPLFKECKIEELVKDCMNEENIEGYVVISDYSMPFGFKKFKTNWYLQKHKMNTDLKSYEIVKFVLEDRIDDVLSLVVSDELRQYIMDVAGKINNFRYFALEKAKKVASLDVARKEIALKYKSDFLFPVLINSISKKSEKDLLKIIDNFILKHCRKEKQTKEFLKMISGYSL